MAHAGQTCPEVCVGVKKLKTFSNTQINHLKGCVEAETRADPKPGVCLLNSAKQ